MGMITVDRLCEESELKDKFEKFYKDLILTNR